MFQIVLGHLLRCIDLLYAKSNHTYKQKCNSSNLLLSDIRIRMHGKRSKFINVLLRLNLLVYVNGRRTLRLANLLRFTCRLGRKRNEQPLIRETSKKYVYKGRIERRDFFFQIWRRRFIEYFLKVKTNHRTLQNVVTATKCVNQNVLRSLHVPQV